MADAGPIRKNVGDTLVYGMDFGFQPELTGNPPAETINTSVAPSFVVTAGSDTNLSFGGGSWSGTVAQAVCSAGTAGVTYLVTVTATYTSGRDRTLTGLVVVAPVTVN
jgi:hypothetical protein